MILAQRYIELLKKALLDELYIENEVRILGALREIVHKRPLTPEKVYDIAPHAKLMTGLQEAKREGVTLGFATKAPDGTLRPNLQLRNYTELAHTMIGRKRLENLQFCIETVLKDNIPGDLIETGIWRGGACIFMRGVLAAYGITDRIVWAADSFEGVPSPTLPQDAGCDLSKTKFPFLAVSLERVQELFQRYELLDEQVKFIKGWFKDALPVAPIKRLAVLRLDGDLYESTMDTLNPLYSKVSQGGFIIVDDYYSVSSCKIAIDEFRARERVVDPTMQIDGASIFWRKS